MQRTRIVHSLSKKRLVTAKVSNTEQVYFYLVVQGEVVCSGGESGVVEKIDNEHDHCITLLLLCRVSFQNNLLVVRSLNAAGGKSASRVVRVS